MLPYILAMSQILDRVLTAARQLGASDVHLKAGLPPIFRIKGDLRTVRDVPALTREAIAQFAVHMMNDRQRAEFEQNLDIDLAYGTPDGVRSWLRHYAAAVSVAADELTVIGDGVLAAV